MNARFNESFNDQGEKPRFMYKRNEIAPRSYQVFELKAGKSEYEPVGSYTVIKEDEDPDFTEKKLMNLIGMMNGKKELIQLGTLTDKRLLFHVVPRTSEESDSPTKVIFREYDGAGVSVDNAVFEIEKGVFDES